jgi:cell division protein FtsQ
MAKLTSKRQTKIQIRNGPRRILQNSVYNGKLLALVVLVAATWLMVSLLVSERYRVRHFKLEGGEALTEADVAALVGMKGRSIWFVQADEVEARVRRSPYVEHAQIQLGLPDTVLVRVTERRPEIQWIHAGTSYAVSQDGLVLAAMPTSQPVTDTATLSNGKAAAASSSEAPGSASIGSVVIVDTTTDRVLAPGDRVDADALEVARRVSLRRSELPAPLQRIEWNATVGVSLIIDRKQAVIGTSARLDEKLAIMVQLLHDRTRFSYLDLRPTTPYYR